MLARENARRFEHRSDGSVDLRPDAVRRDIEAGRPKPGTVLSDEIEELRSFNAQGNGQAFERSKVDGRRPTRYKGIHRLVRHSALTSLRNFARVVIELFHAFKNEFP